MISFFKSKEVQIEHVDRLPVDYDAKLSSYDIEQCQCGKVTLCPITELTVDKIYFKGQEEGQSYYEVPAVSLVKECETYDPEFILLYLPNEKKYASWDKNHWQITIFSNAKWEDIKRDPLLYLNSQWSDSMAKGMKRYSKLDNYHLMQGWPV